MHTNMTNDSTATSNPRQACGPHNGEALAPERSEGDFTLRVLRGKQCGREVSSPSWLPTSYRIFRERILDPAFPCYFGSVAEKRGELFYSFVDNEDVEHLPTTLETFLNVCDAHPRERNNLTVFFAPESTPRDYGFYRRRFWSTLKWLHNHDMHAWPDSFPSDPSHPRWEFCFAGQAIFVLGSAPSYRQRHSRNLGPGFVILFQPRSVFAGIEGDTLAGINARERVRARLCNWDTISPHPDLSSYGDPCTNEWKQYMLPDDNVPATGSCPFYPHIRAEQR